SGDRKPPVDYGVQIRFIKDLDDMGGGYGERSRGVGGLGAAGGSGSSPSPSKYGVAVRVQGISGHPYVVLKDGEKGDSYGVQLKTQPQTQTPILGLSSPYNSLPPRLRDGPQTPKEPYSSVRPPSSPEEDPVEFGSPLKRPPGDGQAGSQGDGERGTKEIPGPAALSVLPPLSVPPTSSKDSEKKDHDELNEAGLKPVRQNGIGGPVKKGIQYTATESSIPDNVEDEPAEAVDTKSLTPIDKLISKFNSSSTATMPSRVRGRTRARASLQFDERKRSHSLDARKEKEAEPPLSPTINPYASTVTPTPTSSLTSPKRTNCSSLGQSTPSVEKVPAVPASKAPTVNQTPRIFVSKEAPPAIAKQQVSNFVVCSTNGGEAEEKQAIYEVLREGSTENEKSLRRKADIIHERLCVYICVYVCVSVYIYLCECMCISLLFSLLNRLMLLMVMCGCAGGEGGNRHSLTTAARSDQERTEAYPGSVKKPKHLCVCVCVCVCVMAELRLEKEGLESRFHQQEDQLAQLQDELRRVSENTPQSDTLHMDLMTLQNELTEAMMLRQKQEETLHMRERELTALKGALKDEVAAHDREMEALREQYSRNMEALRKSMEQVSQSQKEIEEERQKVNVSILALEEELDSYREQGEHWKEQMTSVKQELLQAQQEKKNLEEKLLSLKKQTCETDSHSLTQAQELQGRLDDMKQARLTIDEQKAELVKKEEELTCLRRSSQNKEQELKAEINKLKDQSKKDKEELSKVLETFSFHSALDLQEANTRLRERIARMVQCSHIQFTSVFFIALMFIHINLFIRIIYMKEKKIHPIYRTCMSLKNHTTSCFQTGDKLCNKHNPCTSFFQSQLHTSLPDGRDPDALEDENRLLKTQLEEARRAASRLSHEKEELGRQLEEREKERETLRRNKSELEEQKRMLDRTLEKMNKDVDLMMGDSRQSVHSLQVQLDDFRDRSRKELQESQRQNKDRLAELQRTQNNLKAAQDEVSRLKKELLVCSEERDGAQLDKELLSSRLKHLESERDNERTSQTDRSREIRLLEDKIKTLEIELEEEKTGAELLNERITRSREQMDQLRSDLMQERSARHDLEMDKSSVERQMKELKSRVADMESQPRSSAGVTILESKIQELEDRLHSEEREKSSIQAAQRRMERKLKDVSATLDLERNQHAEQRDQVH
ncbi:cingulin-like isoform X2, partial [Silurus asotus]